MYLRTFSNAFWDSTGNIETLIVCTNGCASDNEINKFLVVFLIAIQITACNNEESQTDIKLSVDGPIQLHPGNQHYFLYKDKPMALISSAEHPCV